MASDARHDIGRAIDERRPRDLLLRELLHSSRVLELDLDAVQLRELVREVRGCACMFRGTVLSVANVTGEVGKNGQGSLGGEAFLGDVRGLGRRQTSRPDDESYGDEPAQPPQGPGTPFRML